MNHLLHHTLSYTQYLQTLKGKLVASLTIRDFAAHMTGMFIPIFLYSFGYSITFIAGFYVLYYVVGWFMYRLPAYIISKHGVYHSLFLSYISMAFANVFLSFAGQSIAFLYLAFLPLLISERCFWPARHIDIARIFSEGKTMKRTASIINTLNMFVAALAPLFGGLLAAQFGPAAALFGSFVVTLFAIALLWQEYVKERGEKIRATFDTKSYGRDMLANAAMNIQMIVTALLWPLLIFLILDSFTSIGLIFSITFAVSMFITYASGNWFNSFPYFKLGIVARMISFPYRAVATTFSTIFAADFIGAIAMALMNSRYTARYYNQAKHSKDIDSYIFSVEKAGELGRIFVFSIFLIVLLLGAAPKTAIIICFAIGFLAVPFSRLIGSEEQE